MPGPGYEDLDVVSRNLGGIARSAVDYIKTRRAQKENEQRFSLIDKYMGAQHPEQADQISAETQLQQALGVAPAQAAQSISQRFTPKFATVRGGQGEVDQFQMDPMTERMDAASKEQLTPPVPRTVQPPVPSLEYVPGEALGAKRETRKVGNRINVKYHEIDKRTGKPTGLWKWQEEGIQPERAAGGAAEPFSLEDVQKVKDRYNQADKIAASYEKRFGADTLKEWTALLEQHQPGFLTMALDPSIPPEHKQQMFMDAFREADPALKAKLTAAGSYATSSANRDANLTGLHDRGYNVEGDKLVKRPAPVDFSGTRGGAGTMGEPAAPAQAAGLPSVTQGETKAQYIQRLKSLGYTIK